MKSQKGFAHLFLLFAALGIIIFSLVSSMAPFKDKLFSFLYPKPSSYAQSINTEPYGVNEWNWTDVSMQSMQEMGVKWMRVGVNWSNIEATQGTYIWDRGANGNIDFYFSQAQKYGMKVSAVVYNAPAWAKQSGINIPQPDLYANFLQVFINRYPGKIAAIEVLNEENTGGCWPIAKCRDSIYYTPVLKSAYQVVKSVDPNILVTTSGFWASPVGYLEDLYTLGAKGYFDVVNFHYYPGKNSPSINYTWLISHYRKIMEKYGDGEKPIWLTEFGWNITDESQNANNIVSPQEQSDYMSYVLDKSMKSGFVNKVFWYVLGLTDDGMAMIHYSDFYSWRTPQPGLTSNISAGDTSLAVAGDWTKRWPIYGTLIIESEKLGYASMALDGSGNTIVQGITRGTNGTTVASHTTGTQVKNQDLTAGFKRQAFYTYKNFIQANPDWSSSQVTALPDVPAPASAPISLTNSDFENGITDWVSSLTIDSTQSHSGASSAKVVNTTGAVVRAWHKAVPVEPGKSYFIKGWVKIDPAGSGNMNAMITTDAQDTSGQYLTGGPSNYYIYSTEGNWREVHFPFRTPDNAGKLVVYLATDTGTGTAWFDDISVEPYNLSVSSPVLISTPTPTPTHSPTPTPIPTSTPAPTPLPTPTPTPSDTMPPTVSVTNPLNNGRVQHGSTVLISASATDNVGVTKVEFYINNSLKCTSVVVPYTCSWKVPGQRRATYNVKATAYDRSANRSSSSITVLAK